jgi:uncharacterized membrane protein YkgB
MRQLEGQNGRIKVDASGYFIEQKNDETNFLICSVVFLFYIKRMRKYFRIEIRSIFLFVHSSILMHFLLSFHMKTHIVSIFLW